MEETVEVRLRVPKKVHEQVVREAEKNLRTAHNQYLYLIILMLDRPRQYWGELNKPEK